MIRILEIISNPSKAISFYRGRLPLGYMQRTFCDIEITPYLGGVPSWDTLILFDVLFIKSPYTEVHYKTIVQAKKCGLKVIVDMDDYIFDVPGYITGAHEFRSVKTQEVVWECIWKSDVVWVSTKTLANAIENKVGRTCVVINNAYDPLFFDNPQEFNNNTNILYRGSYVHMADLNINQHDLVEVVNNNNCHITFMGQSPWFFDEFKNATHIDFLEIQEYIKALPYPSASISIVLLDRKKLFSMCHSNNAWIEGTYAGAVTLAPDADEWRRPGIINYTYDFKEKLNAMINGEYDLKSHHQESWHYIEENCTLQKANELRYESIKKL